VYLIQTVVLYYNPLLALDGKAVKPSCTFRDRDKAA
jgi:hypothetical protein